MFTHVEDVTAAILLAVSARLPPAAANNTFIIGPDTALSYADWIR